MVTSTFQRRILSATVSCHLIQQQTPKRHNEFFVLSASYICGNQAGTVAMPLPLPLPLLQCTFLRALVRKCSTARTVHSYAYPRPPPPHSFPIPPHSTAKVMTNLDHFLDFIAPKFQPYGSLERYVRRMPFQALFFFFSFFSFPFPFPKA